MLVMFEVGNFRKKDETRLRLTSRHRLTTPCLDPVPSERRGSAEFFLIFPPQTSKKNLIMSLSLTSRNIILNNGATCCVHSGHHCAKTSLVVTYGTHLAPEMEWWWWSGCYRWPCWSTVRGWWWSLCRNTMGWKKRQMPILNEFYMVIFTSKFIFPPFPLVLICPGSYIFCGTSAND